MDAASFLVSVSYTHLVESDPSVETVMKGAKAMEAFQPDWIIGIGGGSPIDAAKAMCCLLYTSDAKRSVEDGGCGKLIACGNRCLLAVRGLVDLGRRDARIDVYKRQ